MADNRITTIIDAKFQGDAAFKTAAANVSGFEKSLNTAKTQTSAMGDSLNKLQSRLISIGTVFAAFRIGKDVLDTTAQFEQRMSDVSTIISGDATKSIADLSSGIKELMKTIPKSAEDLGASAYEIYSAGITDTATALDVLKNAGKLAVGGLGSTAEATDILTSALNAFSAEGLSAATTAGIVFEAVKTGKTTVSGIAQGFGSVAASAAGAKVKFAELMAATGALTTSGLPATEAYTQLTAAIKALQNPTDTMSKLLKSIGFSSGQTAIEQIGLVNTLQKLTEASHGNNQVLIEAFGRIEGFKAALALAGANANAFATTLQNMGNGIGDLNEAFEKQGQTFESTYKIFQNNLDLLKIKIGNEVIPQLTAFIKTLNDNAGVLEFAATAVMKLTKVFAEAYAIGKIVAVLKLIEAEMIVVQTRAAVMAVSMGTSMVASSSSMAAVAASASLLKKSIGAIPTGVWITITLLGLEAAFTGISMLQEKIYGASQKAQDEYMGATQQALVLNRALANSDSDSAKLAKRVNEDYLAIQVKIRDAKKNTSLLGSGEKEQANLNKLLKEEAGIKEALINVTKGLSAEDTARLSKQQENLNKALGKGSTTPTVTADVAASPSGGGISTDSGKGASDKAEKEAEKIREAQRKVDESLKTTQDSFYELRLAGIDSLSDLKDAHEKTMDEMADKAKDLRSSLLEITQAYEQVVASADQSTATKAVEQEQKVAKLTQDLKDALNSGQTGEGSRAVDIEAELAKEKKALDKFNKSTSGLEAELAEARRRAGLTDFERSLEDIEKKKKEDEKAFNEKKTKIEEELATLQDSATRENAIYETKRDAIAKINETIKTNWSNILADMEKRTESFATLAETKLKAIQAAFQSIKNMTGDTTAASDTRAAGDFLSPEEKAKLGSTSASQTINLTVEVGGITVGGEADYNKIVKEIESALARAAELINKNTSSTPKL